MQDGSRLELFRPSGAVILYIQQSKDVASTATEIHDIENSIARKPVIRLCLTMGFLAASGNYTIQITQNMLLT